MNKHLKALHSFFNFCCDLFACQSPISYTVDVQEITVAQQLDYLTVNDDRAICDLALYI